MEKLNLLKNVLSKKEISKLYIILFLMLINSLLEVFSIGILIPLLSVTFGVSESSFFTSENFNFLNKLNLNFSVDGIIFLIISLYLIKYLFFLFFTRYQTRYILNLKTNLQRKLFEDYLNKSISFQKGDLKNFNLFLQFFKS